MFGYDSCCVVPCSKNFSAQSDPVSFCVSDNKRLDLTWLDLKLLCRTLMLCWLWRPLWTQVVVFPRTRVLKKIINWHIFKRGATKFPCSSEKMFSNVRINIRLLIHEPHLLTFTEIKKWLFMLFHSLRHFEIPSPDIFSIVHLSPRYPHLCEFTRLTVLWLLASFALDSAGEGEWLITMETVNFRHQPQKK